MLDITAMSLSAAMSLYKYMYFKYIFKYVDKSLSDRGLSKSLVKTLLNNKYRRAYGTVANSQWDTFPPPPPHILS